MARRNYNILLDVLIKKSSVQEQVNKIAKELKSVDVNINAKNIDQATQKTKNLGKATQSVQKSTAQINKDSKGFLNTMSHNIAKALEWAVAMGAVYGTINQIRQGLEYIIELNKSLTNIQIVTGFDESQIDGLAKKYNQLAYEMGVTTQEVAEGSLEWFNG